MSEVPDPARPKYRPDIDGLRGLAVLAVVGFHAYPGLAKAGFIGVDVFFVISGFLITKIILDGLKLGTFSFAEFYARRIRRIFPALVTVLLATFAIGWFVLAASEFKQAGLHIAGGATFTSNFLLWSESGYFDTASERKVLLHLWSLAIEEQFYLLFPLALWAAHKRRFRPLTVIAVIGLASFAWNASIAVSHRTMDFYSPQTRVWELMIGAALASVSARQLSRARRGVVSAVGALLLGIGAVAITKANPFPGWWGLLPTAGAALLIAGGADSWVNRRLLSNRALVGAGLISFPLYLWHWPLLSFAYAHAGGTPSRLLKTALVVVSIVLAWLTYEFLEKPVRSGKGGKSMVACLLTALICTGLIGLAVWWSGGFSFRAVERKLGPYLKTARVTVAYGGCVPPSDAVDEWFCKLGAQSAPPSAFVYGDSHAYSMRPVLARVAHETGRSFLYTGVGGCFLGMHDSSEEDPACQGRGEKVFAYVRDAGIKNVFLVARWSNYLAEGRDGLQDSLRETIEAYRKIGVHVYLFADNPLQKYQPEDALRKSAGTDASINSFSVTAAENAANQEWADRMLATYAGASATVLDFTGAYCPDGLCPLVKGGRFLYIDRDHLSTDGSMLIYPELKKSLNGKLTEE